MNPIMKDESEQTDGIHRIRKRISFSPSIAKDGDGSVSSRIGDEESPTPTRKWIIFILLYISYMGYYLNKKNYGFWIHDIISKSSYITVGNVGLFGTVFEIASGGTKFLGGHFVDTHSPKWILIVALAVIGAANLAVITAWTVLPPSFAMPTMLLAWGINGALQGFGWPALCRIFMHWFPDPKTRGGMYSVLSTNQNLASAIVGPILLVSVSSAMGWKASFYVPACCAFLIVILLAVGIKEDSTQHGKKKKNEAKAKSNNAGSKGFKEALTCVLQDRLLWLLAAAYFLISICRTILSDWAYIMLEDVFILSKAEVNISLFYLELGGLIGGLGIGFLSDRFFNGEREPLMAISAMLAANTFAIFLLLTLVNINTMAIYAIYFLAGLFTFGPHVLIGLLARELTESSIQSTAGGLVKAVGQAGAACAGIPLSMLASAAGWSVSLWIPLLCASLSTFCFVTLWRYRIESYGK